MDFHSFPFGESSGEPLWLAPGAGVARTIASHPPDVK